MFVEDRFREIFEGNPDLDQIQPPDLPPLRRFRPQLCLNLHGGTRSTWMTELSGARYRAGFSHFRQQFVYNVRIPRAQEILGVDRKVHTAEHLASAVFFLGAPAVEIPRAILVPSQPAAPLPVPTAIIHPLASAAEKTWPAENFLAVARHLEQSGVEPIFVGAHSDDLGPFARYQTIQGAPFSQIKNLLAAASLFIGNDSGPAHMAAAFGLPCAVIFSASDPEIWSPWRTEGEVVLAPASTEQVLDALHRLKAAA